MQRLFLPIYCIIAATLCSACYEITLPIEDERNWNKLNELIEQNKLDEAQKFAEHKLKISQSSENKFISTANLAITLLHKTDCAGAQNAMLNTIADDAKTPSLTNPQRAWAHYLLARAFACTADAMSNATQNPPLPSLQADHFYREALDHLKKAEALGLNTAQSLNQLYAHIYPPCKMFQTEPIASANSINSAVDIEALPPTPSVLCATQPAYLRVKPEKGDRLAFSFDFSSLNRTQWLDDSSRLPFSQIRVELIKLENEREIVLESTQQSIPIEISDNELPDTLNLSLPRWTAASDETVYLKLSAQLNGEAQFMIHDDRMPECRKLDDAYEPNESHTAASYLFPGAYNLRKCPKNDDWFAFELEPLNSAWLKFSASPKDTFNMGFEILDEQLTPVLEQSPTEISNDAPLYATFDNTSGEKQKYYLHIRTPEEAENAYQLTWQPAPLCPTDADKVAPNHDPETAYRVIPAQIPEQPILLEPLRLCPESPDIFHFIYTLPAFTDPANIQITFTSGQNNILKTFFIHENDSGEFQIKETSHPSETILTKSFKPDIVPPTLKLSSSEPIFYSLRFEPMKQDENSQDKEDSEDNQQQDQQQNQDDDSQQENNSPDQQTEQPQNPQAGNQADGDKNNPEPSANDNQNASQSDPEAKKKDRVDDMLDNIEDGDKNLQLGKFAKQKRRKPIKNW